MNAIIKHIFEQRGYSLDFISSIENAEHGDLVDIDLLAAELDEIRKNNTTIVIIPDFDTDGIMSGVIWYAGLNELGFDAKLFIPNPKNGYGFSTDDIDSIIKDYPETGAIITCDNGISSKRETEYAISNGLKVFITDHHVEQEDNSPKGIANVVVNPCRLDESYEHKQICGAYVSLQCLQYFAKHHSCKDIESIDLLSVFAGIGTISDTMPVLYENRALVKKSLEISKQVLSQDKYLIYKIKQLKSEEMKNAFRGLYVLLDVLVQNNKIDSIASIDGETFGFYIAPMLNVIKRMDGDMRQAFEIFTSGKPKSNVLYLHMLNEERKVLVAESIDKILSQENKYAPYCYITDAPAGILGLVATKLQSMSGMPVCVVSNKDKNHYSGSGRSPEWYPFVSRTKNMGCLAAGHEGAFGCRFESIETIEQFVENIEHDIEYIIETNGIPEQVEYELSIGQNETKDVLYCDAQLLEDYCNEIKDFAPFGRGFEKPSLAFVIDDSTELEWRRLGSSGQHIKISCNDIDILCWNADDCIENDQLPKRIVVIGDAKINYFAGNKQIQFSGSIMS